MRNLPFCGLDGPCVTTAVFYLGANCDQGIRPGEDSRPNREEDRKLTAWNPLQDGRACPWLCRPSTRRETLCTASLLGASPGALRCVPRRRPLSLPRCHVQRIARRPTLSDSPIKRAGGRDTGSIMTFPPAEAPREAYDSIPGASQSPGE